MHRIDGKALAASIRQELKTQIKARKLKPRLAVLLVGDDPASHLYVTLKQKAAYEVGIDVVIEKLPATVSEAHLIDQIHIWNADQAIDAILVQIPLPYNYEEQKIIDAIDPKKDVDGFHPQNMEKLKQGEFVIISPLVEGCLRLIAQTPLVLNGNKAVILVNSEILSLPFEHLLRRAGAIVTVMHPDHMTPHLLKEADLIIIAIGRPKFLHASMTKSDAVIVDIGTNREDNATVGDVDFDSYADTDAWVTPVPGGAGPMTIAQLLKNVTSLSLLADHGITDRENINSERDETTPSQ